MEKPVRIALDAMGGDFGPSVVVPGADLFLQRHPEVRFLMFGDSAKVSPLLAAHPRLAAATTFRHTEVSVGMADKPSQALRSGRRHSSMWMTVEAVRSDMADCAVSAGNTGALMAMSKICLRTMSQIDRPALAAIWPTLRGRSVVLDVGATIGADAQHYVDLAIMGAAMASSLFGLERPTVGLLNVGVEEVKGIEEVKAASRLLQAIDAPQLDYRGFVEGDDIGRGTVDVVVTEGFTGNIALKTAEGTAKQIAAYLRQALSRNFATKLGALIARSAFTDLRAKLSPREISGAVLLGLDGVVIKGHGGIDADGFSGAIEIAYGMVRRGLLEKIRNMMSLANEPVAAVLEIAGDAEEEVERKADPA
ncbi:phosphate acyltransferase PlsX [uncultured Rhodoblastus sp.]|uniref:phosphate acyltransferase PlsX n=1 Tax=uncultured Rhodoblastus sp. TaxID=543037 RepID=UPI0025F48AEB|nr:phosphate acyltransferase PlsX [uncultured Rhodoblastus sp.]